MNPCQECGENAVQRIYASPVHLAGHTLFRVVERCCACGSERPATEPAAKANTIYHRSNHMYRHLRISIR
jgi:hypothetical protein